MDKKLQDKSSNFFKKEGFYVILFICLCIVATVAVITAKNGKTLKTKPPVVENKVNTPKKLAQNIDEPKLDMENALQVKKDKEKESNKSTTSNSKNITTVSKTTDTKFIKPVDGVLGRSYTEDTIYCETLGTWRTKSGIDIKAQLGTKVVASADGVVEKIDNDNTELGKYIVINHQNGIKTIYSNLDENVSVKKDQKVTKGQQIGKIGKTAGNYSNEKYGDHLHFEVLKDNAGIDPTKYIKYEASR